MCDGFMRDYILPENVAREIKQIKINCYKKISDDLIKKKERRIFRKNKNNIKLRTRIR